MPTSVFASRVVDAALARKGAPRYLTLGGNSGLFAVFKWLPRGLVLWILWKRFSKLKSRAETSTLPYRHQYKPPPVISIAC
ncbi:hypothetical protein BDV93DRAFT_292436 [Ceratobasidium sp. AG-I]|nr:hypothetical protein BDV93DRAFT_292436 [Ceratobasidium sp. AG-I]